MSSLSAADMSCTRTHGRVADKKMLALELTSAIPALPNRDFSKINDMMVKNSPAVERPHWSSHSCMGPRDSTLSALFSTCMARLERK